MTWARVQIACTQGQSKQLRVCIYESTRLLDTIRIMKKKKLNEKHWKVREDWNFETEA